MKKFFCGLEQDEFSIGQLPEYRCNRAGSVDVSRLEEGTGEGTDENIAPVSGGGSSVLCACSSLFVKAPEMRASLSPVSRSGNGIVSFLMSIDRSRHTDSATQSRTSTSRACPTEPSEEGAVQCADHLYGRLLPGLLPRTLD